MELLNVLGPFVPLFQTGLWFVLAGGAFLWLRPQLRSVVDALTRRIEAGSAFKAGPLEVGEELRRLEYVAPAPPPPVAQIEAAPQLKALPAVAGVVNWEPERAEMYRASRGVFLAHLISPSAEPGQQFDIFVFLVRHKSENFADIDHAEFFFGPYWGNEVFKEKPSGARPIGVSTSAYGPFLCTARVHFQDGSIALLSRYIDFEMERVIESNTRMSNNALHQTKRARSARSAGGR